MTDSATVRQMSDEELFESVLESHIKSLKATKSERTVQARRYILQQLHRRLPFGLLYGSEEQIEAWLADLRESGRSLWTLAIYSRHAFAFYRWACARGFLDGDPTARIQVPRTPRLIPNPVTQEEFMHMLRHLPPPLDTAAVLAGFEGMRVSEIAACERQHVTPDLVTIPCGKGGQPGTVPTHPFVLEWIRNRPPALASCSRCSSERSGSSPCRRLIVNRNGKHVSGHWISMTARYHLDKLGLPDVHMHRLRHRYGTLIQQIGGDLRVTQECLRHNSIQSTQGYTLVTNSRRTAAVASLPVPGAPASL